METSICVNCLNAPNCGFITRDKIIWDCNEYVLATNRDKIKNVTVSKTLNYKKVFEAH